MAGKSASRTSQTEAPNEAPKQPDHLSPTPDYGLLPDLIGYNLRISYALASQVFARVFEGEELAPIQFAALEFISRNPHLSQREIARHIETAPTVLVSPLDKLERRGLITRMRSTDDRRRSRIRLTPAGAAFVEDARRRIRSVEEQLTANLTADEQQSLLELLHKMTGRL